MKSIKKIVFTLFLMTAGFAAYSQSVCANSYTTAYSLFQAGRYSEVPPALNSCVTSIQQGGVDLNTIFKTYKLIIYSYGYLDQDAQAETELTNLVNLVGAQVGSREQVQNQLYSTPF